MNKAKLTAAADALLKEANATGNGINCFDLYNLGGSEPYVDIGGGDLWIDPCDFKDNAKAELGLLVNAANFGLKAAWAIFRAAAAETPAVKPVAAHYLRRWQEGIVGSSRHSNVVTYDGSDVVGVCYVPDDRQRAKIIEWQNALVDAAHPTSAEVEELQAEHRILQASYATRNTQLEACERALEHAFAENSDLATKLAAAEEKLARAVSDTGRECFALIEGMPDYWASKVDEWNDGYSNGLIDARPRYRSWVLPGER